MNQIFNIIMRMVMRGLTRKGMNRLSGPKQARRDMTPQEQQADRQARQTGKRAKQAMKIVRRMGRF